MNPEDLQLASYRGAAWFVSSAGMTGGRKDVAKEFVNSDLRVVEDLGLRQRTFSLGGVVAARRKNDGTEITSYQEARDQLLAALERGGTGVLIHPFLGRIENVVCRSYSFLEDTKALGKAQIDINFEISNATGVPVPAEDVLGSVVSGNDLVKAAVEEDIADNYEVTDAFTGNFNDALDKANEIVSEIEDAVAPVAVAIDKLDDYSAQLSEFTANVTSLVRTPVDFADSVIGLFNTMNGLYVGTTATFRATFDALVRLFPFGDGDVSFAVNTSPRTQRQANRDIVNNAMQALALSHAYLNASQFTFDTADDVDTISADLEAQFQKLITSGTLETSVAEELTKLRISVSNFFIETKITKPQIVSVRTPFTSTRLLAYRYYGSSALGETIARLNGLDDLVGVKGSVDILTT